MFTVYIYVLETLADWELGHLISELNSGRFFKKTAASITLKTVSSKKAAITTMGGVKIVPDCLVEEIAENERSFLVLPGADTWDNPQHAAVVEKARTLLLSGGTICAICGATVALANAGLLERRVHTSNGPGFLEMFAPNYRGQNFYQNQPAVAANQLITAGATGALCWTKLIIQQLAVFEPSTLEAWYNYFSTGDPAYFYALMATLPTED